MPKGPKWNWSLIMLDSVQTMSDGMLLPIPKSNSRQKVPSQFTMGIILVPFHFPATGIGKVRIEERAGWLPQQPFILPSLLSFKISLKLLKSGKFFQALADGVLDGDFDIKSKEYILHS